MLRVIFTVSAILIISAPTATAPFLLLWLPLKHRLNATRWLYRKWAAGICRITGNKFQTEGLENFTKEMRVGHLVICNHQGFPDIPILVAHFGLPFIMKKEVLAIPFIGQGAAFYGSLPFDRSSQSARKNVAEKVITQIKTQSTTITFPEGTRSKDGKLRERVQLGLVKKAFEEGIPVIPMTLQNSYKVLSYDKWPFRIHYGIPIYLKVHPVLNPADFDDGEAFSQAAWGKVKEGLVDPF